MLRLLANGLALICGLAFAVPGAAAQGLTLPGPEPVTTPGSAPQPAPLDTMSGTWQGRFHYSDDRSPGRFEYSLEETDGAFAGRCKEPNTFDQSATRYLYADVAGRRLPDGTVTFTKTYDGTGGYSHSVDYRGVLKNGRVEGTWSIGSTTGRFELWR